MHCAASSTFHCQAWKKLSHEEYEKSNLKRSKNNRWISATLRWRSTTSQAEVKDYEESLSGVRQGPEPKSVTPVHDTEMNEFLAQ